MFVAPLHMLQIYDRVLVSRSEITLIVLTALAVGLLVIYGVLEGVRSRLLNKIGLQFDELMSRRTLNTMFEISIKQPSVASPQQIGRDVDSLREFISGPAIIALCDTPWVPVFIAVCFFFHPILGVIALTGAIMVFALAASNEWLTKNKLSEANKLWIKAANDAIVSLRNAEIVKALGMASNLKKNWLMNRDAAMAHQALANDRSSAIIAGGRFVRMSLQVIILAAGGYLAIQDIITPGTMIVASIMMGRALAPVEMAVSQWKNFVLVRSAFHRVNDCLDKLPERQEVMDLPAPVGHVTLQGVYLAPPEKSISETILNNISMDFQPGTVTGIVGPSGSGKSSLVRSIVGVWSVARGSVRFDGADIANWDPEKLGPFIGYMPQDAELFAGSVAQNICRFNDTDPESIISAAEKAGVHELILEFPNGYDTNIGEGGQALSGGQKQRIALARALYNNPKVIVLDEPNSNLDAAGEKALMSALSDAKKSKATVVVVSHRPSLLAVTDKIAVLNKGSLLKFGPRDQILSELNVNVPSNA